MKNKFLVGLLGLIFCLSFAKIALATGEFTEMPANIIGLAGSKVAWGDYDNDGFLDFALAGFKNNPTEVLTKIYHNNGNGTFTDINAGLLGVSRGSISWGDYDNDGYLDILIIGSPNNSCDSSSRIYHNNHNGTFTNINAGLVNVNNGAAYWGDYDNDGYLDIVLTGFAITGFGTSRVYHNNGNGTFTDINAGLVGVYYSNAAWGDYDNDGYLDILLSGADPGVSQYYIFTKVYHNNGNGTFTDINANLPGLSGSSLAWGDYDNDGDLDIFLCGASDSGVISRIYRNNGDGTFTNINANLQGAYEGSVAWGDYDNDGDLDILLCGSGSPLSSRIYRNNGNGTFTDINAGLIPLWGQGAWGDYDNDGDLDILLTGADGSGSIYNCVTKLYRNNLGNNTPIVNTAPYAPVGLNAAVSGNSITLSWGKATDSQTPQNGLNYNIFIGTTQNSADIFSPMARLSDGWRRIAATGSQNENTSWTIKNLVDGTYYWGVQAIDTAFAGSPFALGTFTIGTPTNFTISGKVLLNGVGLNGIQVAATGLSPVTSGMNWVPGYYEFIVNAGWTGTVQAASNQYTFTPVSYPFSGANQNYPNKDFNATPVTFKISGTVLDNLSAPLAGATVTLSTGQSTTTDSVGYYGFPNIDYNWNGTISASKTGYNIVAMAPFMQLPLTSNQVQNFTATTLTFKISGTVQVGNIAGTFLSAGVQLTAVGTGQWANTTYTAVTGIWGTYSLDVPYSWSGDITPAKDFYSFDPVKRTYNNVIAAMAGEDYKAIINLPGTMYTISGKVKTSTGAPISGVEIWAKDDNLLNPEIKVATSGIDGAYSFKEVLGWYGTARPKSTYRFTPESIHYSNLGSNKPNQDYTKL